jgi:hypothetical protein
MLIVADANVLQHMITQLSAYDRTMQQHKTLP